MLGVGVLGLGLWGVSKGLGLRRFVALGRLKALNPNLGRSQE